MNKEKIELLRELDFQMEHNKVLVSMIYKFSRRTYSDKELEHKIEETKKDNDMMKKYINTEFGYDNMTDEEIDSYEIYNDKKFK